LSQADHDTPELHREGAKNAKVKHILRAHCVFAVEAPFPRRKFGGCGPVATPISPIEIRSLSLPELEECPPRSIIW
jgi:hypothetical protein